MASSLEDGVERVVFVNCKILHLVSPPSCAARESIGTSGAALVS